MKFEIKFDGDDITVVDNYKVKIKDSGENPSEIEMPMGTPKTMPIIVQDLNPT